MSNVLSPDKQEQVIRLVRLGCPLQRYGHQLMKLLGELPSVQV